MLDLGYVYNGTGRGGKLNKIILSLLLLLATSAVQAVQTRIDDLRMWNATDRTRVVFDTSAGAEYKYFTLANPDRLVVDFYGAALDARLPLELTRNPYVKRFRSAPHKGDRLRVVLDLKAPVRPEIFALGPNRHRGHRVVVDLYPAGADAAPRKQAPAPRPAPPVIARATEPQEAPTTGRAPAPPKRELAAEDPQALARANRRPPAPPTRKRAAAVLGGARDVVVVIDAGHGGRDVGAIGKHGTYEKDVTLAMARRLALAVDQAAGMRAVLTRADDRFLQLNERIGVARRHEADVFVSIHADSFEDGRVSGSSVYTLSLHRASSEAAKWLAQRENTSGGLLGGMELGVQDDLLREVLFDLNQTGTLQASYELGQNVLIHLRSLGKVHKHTVQKAPFVVLSAPDIPSILVETAFISNPQEEKRLSSQAYQDRMAAALLSGIKDFFMGNPPPATYFAREQERRETEQGKHIAGIGNASDSSL